MGAVEHLKTLCCLGLPPESAMIAVVPVLHEIIPHGWYRICLLNPDTSITSRYAENPACELIFRERIGKFLNDTTSLVSIYVPSFHAVGIGWSLHLQGRGYLESDYYREIESQFELLLGLRCDNRRRWTDYCRDAIDAPARRPPFFRGRCVVSRPAASLAGTCAAAKISVSCCCWRARVFCCRRAAGVKRSNNFDAAG